MKVYLWIPMLWLCLFGAQAQNKEKSDSLVRLISAKQMEQVERDGQNYRKVTGPARFLHNDTYLLCDTAFWNMNTSIIDCIGHVSILQEDTRLTSDKLTYLVDDDLAQFRGSLVELEDKEGNMLRTRHLDYNTKDSVAVFMNGGAMRDHTGQIIESIDGKYESKIKLFTFLRNVNMFTDSVFIKTSKLLYHSNTNLAEFSGEIDAWHEKSLLSSEEGWYDRDKELFFFRRKVHGQNETQEAWSDSLYFNRTLMELEMLGNAQVTDTTRNAHAMAGRMFYQDSISTLTMTRDPVVIGVVDGQEGQSADTVYSRANKYIYRTLPRFAVDSSIVGNARKRLKDLEMDPVAEYRKKAAEAAAQKAAEAAKLDPNNPANRGSLKKGGLVVADSPKGKGGGALKGKGGAKAEGMPDQVGHDRKPGKDVGAGPGKSGADTTGAKALPALAGSGLPAIAGADSTSVIAGADSTSVIAGPDRQSPADSTAAPKPAAPKDSTKISFLTAIGNVKVFKKDLQVVTDSLEYNAIDSLIRMYKRPLIWNDPTRQYTSDSLFAVVRGQNLEKASLMSDAFVTIQEEDGISYDQIRSTEMMAYFDTTGAIRRFDALGDADAIFYIKEDSTYATINITKSKMLSAGFKDGDIDVVHYYDASKSDAYPLAQTRKEQRTLKGFEWQQEKRPAGPWDITTKTLRPSQRKQYSARPEPTFTYTDVYYPGYIAGVKDEIELNRIARERRRQEKARREAFVKDSLAKAALRDSLARPAADSLHHRTDSLKTASDSLKTALSDSIKTAAADSLKAAKPDSLAAAPLTAKELKALEKEKRRKEKEALAKAKQEAREREWARLDSLDAVKAAAKAEKKLKKEREKKRKIYLENLAEERKEKILLEKYIEYYRRKKAAEEHKAAAKALKEQAAKAASQPALKPKDSQ